MHVDAFFDYCLGHPHPYYNSRVSNDHEEDIADAVPKEEDLALRALFPEWKPKKGRKKAMDELRPSKKSRLDTQNVGAHTGNSTYAPWSAMPDDFEQHDDWGTNSVFSTSGRAENVRHTDPSQACQRWDFSGPPQRSSPLRYPQSAVIPRFKNQDVLFEREPRSAITPNSTNRLYYNRSFDQPAIRSWIPPREVGSDDSSNQQQLDTSNGGNPTVTLCPGMTMAYEPSLGQANCDPLCAGSNNHEVTGNAGREPNGSFVHPTATVSRPVKLQLQVPRGSPKPPIRLATPQLLINGEFRQPSTFIETQTLRDVAGQRIHNAQDSHDLHSGASLRPNIQTPLQSSAFPNSIAHMFSHDIQRGRVSDGSALSEKNASAIAEAIIKQIISQCSPNCSSETLVVYCATYLGLGSQLGLGSRREGPLYIKILPEEGPTPRFRDMDSIPTPSTALDKSAYSRSRTQCIINYDLLISPGFTMKTTIHVTVFLDLRTHTKSSDSLHVDRTTRNKLPTALEDSDEELLLAGSGVDWKQRYLNLKRQIRKRDAALKLYKKNILEAVMDDI